MFSVARPDGVDLAISLNLPGRHNVLNALAAIAVAQELGIGDDLICKALASFQGIGRRFQIERDMDFGAGAVTLIDDYAHHPTEIGATFAALRSGWPHRRLVCVFQPHRYTRTRALFEDFVSVLSEVDVLVLLDVYPAGERPITGADGRSLARAIRLRGKVEPVFADGLADLPVILSRLCRSGDLVAVLGAGDIGQLVPHLRSIREDLIRGVDCV